MPSPTNSSNMAVSVTTLRTPVDQQRTHKIRAATSWRSGSSPPYTAIKAQCSFEEDSDVALFRYILAHTPTPPCMKNDYSEWPMRKHSALVNVVNDPLYYTREHRVLREYRGWCASFINRLTLSAENFHYDIKAEYAFFRKHLSVDAFLTQRFAAGQRQIADHGRSTSDSSWGSGNSANSFSHNILAQSYALVSTREPKPEVDAGALANPSSSAMVIYGSDEFQPSHKRMGLRGSVTPEREREALDARISPNTNYEGHRSPFAIKCELTPLEESCAVRIERIHADTTYQEFFDDIREGKVFQFSWQEPEPPYHTGRSARLVFSTRIATEHYIKRASYNRRSSYGGIWFHGERIYVKWNNSHCPAMEPGEAEQTRILQIRANQDEHNLEQTIKRIKEFVVFDLVSFNEWLVPGNKKVIELVFPSIYGQSRQAMKCLLKGKFKDGLDYAFEVRYGLDPCEERSIWS